MKRASAILKNKIIFIQGYSETESGFWIASGPVFSASIDHVCQIGENIRRSLAQSTRHVGDPNPSDWKLIQEPMLRATNSKNWSDLARKSRAVGVLYEGGVVTMVPTSRYENEGGVALASRSIDFVRSDTDIGDFLLSAFSECS